MTVCLCRLACVGEHSIKRKAVYSGRTRHIDGSYQFAFPRLRDEEILWHADRGEIQSTVLWIFGVLSNAFVFVFDLVVDRLGLGLG